MAAYYINRNPQPASGEYEVHRDGCPHPPSYQNRIPLGSYATCHPAVAEAKRRWPNAAHKINGCYYCCRPCHTG